MALLVLFFWGGGGVGGAYTWRGDLTEGSWRYWFWGGLYLEGLIFGILW